MPSVPGMNITPLERRFWKHVQKSSCGCWIWIGARRGSGDEGYGTIFIANDYEDGVRIRRRQDSAHRVSWILCRGVIPEGLQVLHRCDVTLCVNPDHLFLGSRSDNMRDMTEKGRRRGPYGANHPRAKLTPDDVRAIRHLVLTGQASRRGLARRYGVSHQVVMGIVLGRIWKSVSL